MGQAIRRCLATATKCELDDEASSASSDSAAAAGSLRLFLAIELSEAAKAATGRLIQHLQDGHPDAGSAVKWVQPELMHITLRFLGQVEPQCRLELEAALPGVAASVGPFHLTFAQGGVFWERARKPSVLWLGVPDASSDDEGAEDPGHLFEHLAASVEGACTTAGYEVDARPKLAHVTLGRVRRQRKGREQKGEALRLLGEALEAVRLEEPLRVNVNEVVLMRTGCGLTSAGSVCAVA